nr:flavodoxin family protein [uncultured Desulfobulbus sp.]
MNILLLNGSPRQGGNTDLLLEHISGGIKQAGYRAEHIHLAQCIITPCIGCGHCEKQGTCIFDDDMVPLYQKIDQADRIVIGSPIYFYGVTAQTKIFIDRCQALWSRKYLLGEIKPNRGHRKGYFVSVAATDGGKIFEGAKLTVRYGFDAMEFNYNGELLVKGVDAKGDILKRAYYLKQAQQLGIEICQK